MHKWIKHLYQAICFWPKWLASNLLKVIDSRRSSSQRWPSLYSNSRNNTNGRVQLVSMDWAVGGRSLVGVQEGGVWGCRGHWNLSTGYCWGCWQILHSAVCHKRTSGTETLHTGLAHWPSIVTLCWVDFHCLVRWGQYIVFFNVKLNYNIKA